MKLLVSGAAHLDEACCSEASAVCEINSRAPHSFLQYFLHFQCFANSSMHDVTRGKISSLRSHSLRRSGKSVPNVARDGTAPGWDNLGRWLATVFRSLPDEESRFLWE